MDKKWVGRGRANSTKSGWGKRIKREGRRAIYAEREASYRNERQRYRKQDKTEREKASYLRYTSIFWICVRALFVSAYISRY